MKKSLYYLSVIILFVFAVLWRFFVPLDTFYNIGYLFLILLVYFIIYLSNKNKAFTYSVFFAIGLLLGNLSSKGSDFNRFIEICLVCLLGILMVLGADRILRNKGLIA